MNDPCKFSKSLNQLIRINLKRAEVYKNAFIITNDPILKRLFNRFFTRSILHASILSGEVLKLGRAPANERNVIHQIIRVLIMIQMTLTPRSGRGLLFTCEYCEQDTGKAYTDAINNARGLQDEQIKLLSGLNDELKTDFSTIIKLRQSGQFAFS